MKLYLISKNPMINKLVTLSASKLGVEMVESQELDTSINAELVLLDDECFEAETFEVYKGQNAAVKTILFYSKAAERIEGFDAYIQKPFLPTDLVKTLSDISGIGVEDPTKNGVDSDILELDGGDDLGELNLDEELDFSNLDDLDLGGDKELSLDDNIGELSESKEPSQENAVESLEDNKESNGDLQILDKSDVDTIKDLLDDSKEAVNDAALELGLNEELDGVAESATKSDVEQEIDAAEQKEEHQEAVLEAMGESVDIDGDALDSSLSGDDNFDFSLEDIMGSDSKDMQISENAELETKEDSKESINQELQDAIEIGDVEEINLQDMDLDDDKSVESMESLGDDENKQIKDINAESNVEDTIEAVESENIESSNTNDVLDEIEFNHDATEDANNNQDARMDTEETEGVLEETQEGLDGMTSQVDSVDLNLEENLEMESKTDSAVTKNSNDEFAALSLEEMGEALGEPVQKDPVPASIVSKESSQTQEMQLPSSIQANSLESLIGALQTLQTQSLKELLSGATVNISIQFPKKDKN